MAMRGDASVVKGVNEAGWPRGAFGVHASHMRSLLSFGFLRLLSSGFPHFASSALLRLLCARASEFVQRLIFSRSGVFVEIPAVLCCCSGFSREAAFAQNCVVVALARCLRYAFSFSMHCGWDGKRS